MIFQNGSAVYFIFIFQTAADRDELLLKPKTFTRQYLNELKVLGKFKCYVSSGERLFLLGLGVNSRICTQTNIHLYWIALSVFFQTVLTTLTADPASGVARPISEGRHSQRSAESRGFSPGTPVSPHRES